jgi:hypothetical protein
MKYLFTAPGHRPIHIDSPIQDGDLVADVEGESYSMGVPGPWVRARGTIGKTPRVAYVFACRPIEPGVKP